MLFGLVTRRELDKAIAEALEELKRVQQVHDFEWSRWYDKFRALYAQWVKRDRAAAGGEGVSDEPGAGDGHDPAASLPRAARFPNSRRGF